MTPMYGYATHESVHTGAPDQFLLVTPMDGYATH